MKSFTRFFFEPLPGSGTNPAALTPVTQGDRIIIIDSVRGIALLGILLMNIMVFALPQQLMMNIYIRNELSGPNYYLWWITGGIFEGTMRGLFTLLFGAGCLLLIQRLEKKQPGLYVADIYYRRLIWLLLFGLLNAFIFLWFGDILYSYAICGLFLLPFRKMKAGWLLGLGILLMFISTFKSTLDIYSAKAIRVKGEKIEALLKKNPDLKLTETQEADKTKWEGFKERSKIENLRKKVDESIKDMHKGYFSIMGTVKDMNVRIQSTLFYTEYFWDIMCLLLIGMALFKWGVLTGGRSKRFYWLMMLTSYTLGLTSGIYELQAMFHTRFDYTRLADKIGIFYYHEKRLLTTLGHLGVIMLLYKYGIARAFLNSMAKVGQMAFTNYLAQSIICAFIFLGFGLGKYGVLQRYQVYLVMAGIWVFQVIFSMVWLRYFYFGPFEWVWRSLTYWKKQPMRKVRSTTIQPTLA